MTNSVDYEINKELGECYLFMSEFDKAKDYYQKAIVADSKQVDPYLGLAAIYLALNDLNAALSMYKKADSIQRNDKTISGIAMIECEQGKHESSFALFCEALDHNPTNMVAINGIVQLGYFLNKLDDIIPYLKNAVTEKEDEAIRYALAACLLTIGNDEEAREHLEVLLGLNPANAEALKLYAQFAA